METIKEKIKEVLKAMGIEEAEIESRKDNNAKERELLMVNLEISPREAKRFLDEEAEGLMSLQHILRVMILRQEGFGQPLLMLDINGHKREREKILMELAIKAAQKVRRTKKPVALSPMPAFERRFIHMKLAEHPDIVTESTGEEPERRVVVRLYP